VHWGSATRVPGTKAVAAGGYARVNSISCASAGECAAGGDYLDHHLHFQAFVVSEHGGVWGNAIEVPGLAALNVRGDAEVNSISCGSPGNCSAGGYYLGGRAFVVPERGGVWGSAIEVPVAADLNVTDDATVYSVSCGSPRTCTALGAYDIGVVDPAYPPSGQTFVISEHDGVWGKRHDVPGKENSVSCGGAGSCVAVGSSQDGQGVDHAFLVVERNGKWGKGKRVAGMWALSAGRTSEAQSVSCASPGNCAVGGVYAGEARGRTSAFVLDEKHGTWSKPTPVPGIANATVTSISCTSEGNCAAGGDYDAYGNYPRQPFVVAEEKGTWSKPVTVRGLRALNADHVGLVTSVSCAGEGNCAAVGTYASGEDDDHNPWYFRAFVVTDHDGAWSRPQHLPGLGPAVEPSSVSCVRSGNCTIGGLSSSDGQPYPWSTFQGQAFVTAP